MKKKIPIYFDSKTLALAQVYGMILKSKYQFIPRPILIKKTANQNIKKEQIVLNVLNETKEKIQTPINFLYPDSKYKTKLYSHRSKTKLNSPIKLL